MSQFEVTFPHVAEAWLTVERAPRIGTDSAEERAWVPAYWATPTQD